MKQLLFLLLFFPVSLFSQIYVDGEDINADDEIQYCQISAVIGYKKTMNIILDYGQGIKSWIAKTKIKNKEKEVVEFNGLVQLMNFMNQNGWELVDSFYRKDQNREKYIFKKKKKTN
jgi:hypothetical protein